MTGKSAGKIPAKKIAVASALKAKLLANGVDVKTLEQDFLLWKAGGDDDSYTFGRDGLGQGSKHLSHVHMIPTVAIDLLKWNISWKRYSNRTSDRYLFYAKDNLYGFLLLDIVDDPGAHQVWNSEPHKIKVLETAAENFCSTGAIPL